MSGADCLLSVQHVVCVIFQANMYVIVRRGVNPFHRCRSGRKYSYDSRGNIVSRL